MTICHQIGSCYFNAQVRTRIIPRGFHIHAHTLGERWRWRKPFILLSPHQDSISKAYYGYKNCLILWLPEYQLLLPFEKSIQYLSFRGSVVMYMEKKKPWYFSNNYILLLPSPIQNSWLYFQRNVSKHKVIKHYQFQFNLPLQLTT